jgi:exportin-1
MACDTFIKIANKCRRHFVALQPGETEPFIDEIVRNMRKITCDLTPHQVHTFYEACGYMISAQGQKSIQERLINDLMSLPNAAVSSRFLPLCDQSLTYGLVGSNHTNCQQ